MVRLGKGWYLLAYLLVLFNLVSCTGSNSTPITEDTPFHSDRGKLITAISQYSFPANEIQSPLDSISKSYGVNFPFTITQDVEIIDIHYLTQGLNNESVTVSARIFYPKNKQNELPMAVLNHGTIFEDKDAPTNWGYTMLQTGLTYAGTGYIAVAPDYIGYGISGDFHPYIHAESSANTVIDAIRATRSLMTELGLKGNDQLFITGYSEGGYVSMAAAKTIETSHANEFTLTAVAPNAGPYDMMGTMLDIILDGENEYSFPAYLPFVVFGYEEAYDLDLQADDVLKLEYASLKSMFEGSASATDINALLPKIPRDLFTDNFLFQMESMADTSFENILIENTIFLWVPKTKLRLHHNPGDEIIPIKNAEVAYDYFVDNGASQVELNKNFETAGHSEGALEITIATKIWFDSLLN